MKSLSLAYLLKGRVIFGSVFFFGHPYIVYASYNVKVHLTAMLIHY